MCSECVYTTLECQFLCMVNFMAISSGFYSAGQSERGWHSTHMICHPVLHKWMFEGLDSFSYLKEYLQWLAPEVSQLWGASGKRRESLGLPWLPLISCFLFFPSLRAFVAVWRAGQCQHHNKQLVQYTQALWTLKCQLANWLTARPCCVLFASGPNNATQHL